MTNNTIIRPIIFLVVVLAQIGVLAAMIVQREDLLEHGTRVILQCEPVDPRSLLSGDFITLRYTITSFQQAELARLNPAGEIFRENQTVFVSLRKSETGPEWGPVALSADRARLAGSGPVILRGRVRAVEVPDSSDPRPPSWIEIGYGVEAYFVPQFKGRPIETELARTTVEIAVDGESGEGAIRRLFIEGEEVRFY